MSNDALHARYRVDMLTTPRAGWLLVVLVAGCASRTSPEAAAVASDSGAADAAACVGEKVPASLRACSVDADCVVVAHATNCCNDTVYTGIAKVSLGTFNTCEASWRTTFPACGCEAAPSIEDGTGTPPVDASQVVAKCSAHVCSATAK